MLVLPIQLQAWILSLDHWDNQLLNASPGEILVLDPDVVTPSQLAMAKAKGLIPLAWLNIGAFEPGRTFSDHLDPKVLFLPGKAPKEGTQWVRFYTSSWRKVLRERVREIAHAGFRGVFVTGLEAPMQITDEPLPIADMIALVARLRTWVNAQIPGGMLLGFGPLPALKALGPDLPIHGLVFSGIWSGPMGKTLRPWDRDALLKVINAAFPSHIKRFSLDDPGGRIPPATISQSARRLGFDPAFIPLPIRIIRRPLP